MLGHVVLFWRKWKSKTNKLTIDSYSVQKTQSWGNVCELDCLLKKLIETFMVAISKHCGGMMLMEEVVRFLWIAGTLSTQHLQIIVKFVSRKKEGYEFLNSDKTYNVHSRFWHVVVPYLLLWFEIHTVYITFFLRTITS